MQCWKWERKILLDETGELSEREGRRLSDHLAACPHCQDYRNTARRLATGASGGLPSGSPSPAVMARIRAAAEESIAPRPVLFPRPIVEALALAAALVLVVGLWLHLSDSGRMERIDDMVAVVSAVSGDALADFDEDYQAGTGAEQKLQALARQLLILEGASELESSQGEWFPSETSTEGGARQPTALQPRSTAAYPPGRCV